MSFARHVVLLSAGLAAGVSTAPYFCTAASDPTRFVDTTATLTDPLKRSRRTEELATFNLCSSPMPTSGLEPGGGGAWSSVVEGACRVITLVAGGGAAGVRAAVISGAHRTALAASDAATMTTTADSGAADTVAGITTSKPNTAAAGTESLRAAPHKLKERFLRYAQRDPESGELVLTLDGFVRCMLLLPVTAAEEVVPALYPGTRRDVEHHSPQRPASPSLWLQRLPETVRRRFEHFFHCVDLDGTNTIDYAEFVVLFTFLSTRQQMLKRAFHVFDLDDNGRLSEQEFCRLLNTIMVDPAVQVRCTPSGSKNNGEANVAGALGTSPSITSGAGESRSSKRQRQRHKDELSFEVPSDLMRPLLFGPLPLHVGAPPGSTHYNGLADATASVSSSSSSSPAADLRGLQKDAGALAGTRLSIPKTAEPRNTAEGFDSSEALDVKPQKGSASLNAPAALTSSFSSLWGGVCLGVQSAWSQLWQHNVFHPPAFVSNATAAAAPSRMAELQEMAAQDTLLETVSYPTFLYRMDYLRWELRAIEFGLCDPENKGSISVEDCRKLLRRDRLGITDGATAETPTTGGSPTRTTTAAAVATNTRPARELLRTTPVTWQVYQKLFDVIKESNVILPALELMLESLPPVPKDVLSGGAIPDAELKPATLAVQAVVQQTVLRYNNSRATEADNDAQASIEAAEQESSAKHISETEMEKQAHHSAVSAPSTEATAQEHYNEERFGLSSDPAQSPEEKQKQARQLQATLVRPTALTWTQFGHAVAAVSTIPPLSKTEEALFRALLDEDGSNTLSPPEFARLCALKESFFADDLPRFDEPKRNTVQQFFFCMQQLE